MNPICQWTLVKYSGLSARLLYFVGTARRVLVGNLPMSSSRTIIRQSGAAFYCRRTCSLISSLGEWLQWKTAILDIFAVRNDALNTRVHGRS